MEDIDKLISNLEQKESTSFNEIDNLLDSMNDLIMKTNDELDKGKNKEGTKIKDIFEKGENELKKLKLVPKLNRICNSYYHKYKELNKKIDENIKDMNYLNDKSLLKFLGNIDEKLIKELILEHLIRKGNTKTVEKYVDESHLENNVKKELSLFKEYYEILNDLKNNNLDLLYNWCVKNTDILLKPEKNEKLDEEKNIYFECVKYKYLLYIKDTSKTIDDYISFSRKIFKPFLSNTYYINKISELMTLLIVRKNTDMIIDEDEKIYKNKYYDIDVKKGIGDIKNLFVDTFFNLNHKIKNDTLDMILLAGRYALPQVVEAEDKLAKEKDKKINETDKDKNQLMYSIELPEELIYHNIFVCPVSKEIATAENKPLRLNCGHCICKNSFEKIEKQGISRNQIKCPICNQVGKVEDVMTLEIF